MPSTTFTRDFEQRLGAQLDRLTAAGFPAIAEALAGFVRERRGRVRAQGMSSDIGRVMIDLMDECERLADELTDAPIFDDPDPSTDA